MSRLRAFLSPLLLLSLTLVLIHSPQCYADDFNLEHVASSELHLLGSGVINKKSHEGLAIACANTHCSQLRFVWFTESGTFFLGETIKGPNLDQVSDHKVKEQAFEFVLERFFSNHHSPQSARKIEKKTNRTFLTLFGATIVGGLAVSTSGLGLAGFYLFAAPIGGASYWSITPDYTNRMVKTQQTVIRFSDDEGWNWAADAKKVSPDDFEQLLYRIIKGVPLISIRYENGERFDHHRAMAVERRLGRQYYKLSEKGVRF